MSYVQEKSLRLTNMGAPIFVKHTLFPEHMTFSILLYAFNSFSFYLFYHIMIE